MAGIVYMFFLETTKFFRFQLFPKKKKEILGNEFYRNQQSTTT